MKLTELVVMLKSTGYPVAYSHFKSVPSIPYITYRTPNTNNFIADNVVYIHNTDIQVELYTDKKDLEAEQSLEGILNDNKIPWEVDEVWIDSEELFQRIYYIGVNINA